MAQLHAEEHSGSPSSAEVWKPGQLAAPPAQRDPLHRARVRLLLAALNLWLVCVAWPWLFGGLPGPLGWLASLSPLAVAAVGAARLSPRGGERQAREAPWLLLAAFPLSIAACMAAQDEAVNRDALGPFAMTVAVVSLWAHGVASLWALGTGASSMRTRVRDVAPEPWDVPQAPPPRLQLAVVTITALGALAIGLLAPAWGGMARVRQHWGPAAIEGGLLTQVIAVALAVYLLAVAVGGGLRSARSPEAPPSTTRFALLLASAALGFTFYWIVRAP